MHGEWSWDRWREDIPVDSWSSGYMLYCKHLLPLRSNSEAHYLSSDLSTRPVQSCLSPHAPSRGHCRMWKLPRFRVTRVYIHGDSLTRKAHSWANDGQCVRLEVEQWPCRTTSILFRHQVLSDIWRRSCKAQLRLEWLSRISCSKRFIYGISNNLSPIRIA